MFHRGIGSAKVSGMLIDQKLDLLMDYTGAGSCNHRRTQQWQLWPSRVQQGSDMRVVWLPWRVLFLLDSCTRRLASCAQKCRRGFSTSRLALAHVQCMWVVP